MTPVRLLVVDHDRAFRRELVTLLRSEDGFAVVGQAGDWQRAVQLTRERRPDVIVVDAGTPGMDPAEATRRLGKMTPQAQILMLTVADDDRGLLAALKGGAHGHIPRDVQADRLLEAIRRLQAGRAGSLPTRTDDGERIVVAAEAGRASALERVIGALPLPCALSAGLFATALGPPGTIALGFLATGSWAASVELYSGGLPAAEPWQKVTAILLWWLTYFVVFVAARWERLAIAPESQALRELLPADVEPPWIARNQSAAWPAALLAVVLTVVSWPFVIAVLRGLDGAHQPLLGVLWVSQNVPRLGLFFLGLGTLFWLTIAAMLGLRWLGRRPLQLKPLEDDALLGLRPAGSMALTAASTYIAVASLLALQLALAPAIGAFGPALAVSTALGAGLFFAPLWGLHRRMLEKKNERQAEVRSRLLRLGFAGRPDPPSDPSSAVDLADLQKQLARITEVLALEAAGRKIDASATWPFDLAILQSLGGAVMLPILITLLTELVRQLLGL